LANETFSKNILKILIVDDHALLREGLGQVLLSMYPALELLQAGSGAIAIDLLLPHRDIDLVLLDYHLPDINGLEVLRQMGRIQPSLVVLMISGSTTLQLISQSLNAGAAGFVTKSGNTDDLRQAIAQVLAGEIYIPQEVRSQAKTAAIATTAPLSKKQEQVLRLLMDGQTNREIAKALFVSEETIKTHVSAILRYFDAENRTQAVRAAVNYAYSTSA
jgi:DNA-binding NarL/FixJ family response regulator